MPPRCPNIPNTLTPFLYPFLVSNVRTGGYRTLSNSLVRRYEVTLEQHTFEEGSHLNPPPTDYSNTAFADKATITVHSGAGGHGCISFLREKFIAAGPANGGDGGTGGNVYIQAVRGLTSLHKLARRTNIKAGRGRNGQGKTKGGERGEDVIIQVPVGTVVREVDRVDPVAIEEQLAKINAGREDSKADGINGRGPWKWDKTKWLLYPAITKEDIATAEFPKLPRGRKSMLAMSQAKAPVSLDLSMPMEQPILLAAGAIGGLGNPHFVTKTAPRPKFATKGEQGIKITLELELKLLADVGLVGLPNAGKSTLLRAMSKSRARIGNWAFTTLQPNIGTVIIDSHHGRPILQSNIADGEPRTHFTIADIPGLVADAHLDRGLGISFLRHVERARVLAFVVDLNAGDAVTALKALWREVGLYEQMKVQEEKDTANAIVQWTPFETVDDAIRNTPETVIVNHGPTFDNPLGPSLPSIADKPWFVVATKADLPNTQENYQNLKEYIQRVNDGAEGHPSGQKKVWQGQVEAIPISAINGHGTERITECTIDLLDV
ncbi:hypothetical protein B0O99DRAFT_628342 [Bisporella sp. PMI_857]|nr:hypothetical protein B0O99DRAFT_628342 [Bisporella sp. PMI_857]